MNMDSVSTMTSDPFRVGRWAVRRPGELRSTDALREEPVAGTRKVSGAEESAFPVGKEKKEAAERGKSLRKKLEEPVFKPVGELDAEERAELRELQAKDAQVRARELARFGTAGNLALGARYEYTRGPDGRQYATKGEVKVDTAMEGDPEKDLEKAERMQAAALAGSSSDEVGLRLSALSRLRALQAASDLARRIEEEVEETDREKDPDKRKTGEQMAETALMREMLSRYLGTAFPGAVLGQG